MAQMRSLRDEHITPGWLRGMLVALLISSIGIFVQSTAQAWILWEQTRQSSLLALLALVQAAPLLGVPLLGGYLADRWPRRMLLVGTQSALAVIALSLGLQSMTGRLSVTYLIGFAALTATIAALDNPIRQVYLPGVVPAQARSRIIGLNALVYNLGAALGPSVAGLLLPIGAGWAFLLNAASYLFVVAYLVRGPAGVIDRRSDHDHSAASLSLCGASLLVCLLLLIAAVSLLGRAYPHILPILATRQWHQQARGYGFLAALPGVGAIAAALGVAWWGARARLHRAYWITALLLGIVIAALGRANTPLSAGLLLVLAGFTATATMVLSNAGLQQLAPDRYRGRIMSIYTLLAAGMPPVGGWMLGQAFSRYSERTVLLFSGSGLIIVTLLLWRRAAGKQ